jgi:hypothetical protein
VVYSMDKMTRSGTDLEAIPYCVKLPNRFGRRAVPSFWIPNDGTVEGKPRHVSMESPKSPP